MSSVTGKRSGGGIALDERDEEYTEEPTAVVPLVRPEATTVDVSEPGEDSAGDKGSLARKLG